MTDASPTIGQWLVLTAGAVSGLWLVVRGWQQFKQPTCSYPVGTGWWIRLLKWQLPDEYHAQVNRFFFDPAVVRFFAMLAMFVGFGMVLTLVLALVVSRFS